MKLNRPNMSLRPPSQPKSLSLNLNLSNKNMMPRMKNQTPTKTAQFKTWRRKCLHNDHPTTKAFSNMMMKPSRTLTIRHLKVLKRRMT